MAHLRGGRPKRPAPRAAPARRRATPRAHAIPGSWRQGLIAVARIHETPAMRNHTILVSLALLALAAAFALGHDETAPAPASADAEIPTERGVALKGSVNRPAKGN